jgi:hypothetical protein
MKDKKVTGTFYYSYNVNLKKSNPKIRKVLLEINNSAKIVQDTTEVKKIVNKFIKNPKSFSIKKIHKLNISAVEKLAVIQSLLKLKSQ